MEERVTRLESHFEHIQTASLLGVTAKGFEWIK